jgi:hypothetical protein
LSGASYGLACLIDAYMDVGGRATQEAKAEYEREFEGVCIGRSSPSWRRGIGASMHGRANAFVARVKIKSSRSDSIKKRPKGRFLNAI